MAKYTDRNNLTTITYKVGDTIEITNTVTNIPVKFNYGVYKFEVWGAKGGDLPSYGKYGGLGGYSYGTITLEDNTYMYLTTNYGWGYGVRTSPSGGGGTDVKYRGTTLQSRIMVAGGGGGAGPGGSSGRNGGYGGGLIGGRGLNNGGGGAYQNGGGSATRQEGYGKFGKGGDGYGAYSGAGGGGGYYGGGGGSDLSSGQPGGGGSGFVSGLAGCNAVNASGTHTNQPVHYSGLKFINAGMTINNSSYTNGRILITLLEVPEVILPNSYTYFLNEYGTLYYYVNGVKTTLGKTISNVSGRDFESKGNYNLEWAGDKRNFLVCSKTPSVGIKVFPYEQKIYKSLPKILTNVENIGKIIITDSGSGIKYIFSNGKNWYGADWNIVKLEDVDSSSAISGAELNAGSEKMKEIFKNVEKVNFIAFLTEVDSLAKSVSIEVIKKPTSKMKILKSMWEEVQTVKDIKVYLKSGFDKIEIIYDVDGNSL